MAYYLISTDFAGKEPETLITWKGVDYYYNTEDSDLNPAFSELGMGLNVASGDEVTVLAGDYEVIMSSGWYTNSGTITISNVKYDADHAATEDDIYAATSVDIEATLKNNGTLIVQSADPDADLEFSITKLTNAGTVSIAGALVDVTTLTNNGSVSIANTAFAASSVTNGENKSFTLENSTFTALNTVVNDGTFYVTNSDVDADFDGGAINLTGAFGDATDITGAADITATSVILDGTASIEGSKLTSEGDGIDLYGTASITADHVVVNSRIYVFGKNTLVLDDISGSAMISVRDGGELTHSSIERIVYFADDTTISGTSYIKTVSIKGTSIDPESSGYRSLTITGNFTSGKIDTGTSAEPKPNSAFIYFNDAIADLGTLAVTGQSVITVTDSKIGASVVNLSGNIVVEGESSLVFEKVSPNTTYGDSTINAGGATLNNTEIAKTSATFAVAEATTLTLKGENTILANIANDGTIILNSEGEGDEFEAASLTGNVTGSVVISAGAVVLDNDPETAAKGSAQVIKGDISEADVVNNTDYTKYEHATGYYLTLEDKTTLYVNSEYAITDGSAITSDGHIFGFNAFNSLGAALANLADDTAAIEITTDTALNLDYTVEKTIGQDLTISGDYKATFNFSGHNDLVLTVTEGKTLTLADGTTLETTGEDGYIVLGGAGAYAIQGTVDSVSQVAFWTDATVSGEVISEYTGANTGMVLFRSAKQGSGDGVVINGGSVDTGRAFLVSGKLTADDADINATVLEFTQNLDEASATPWWASEVVNENGEALLGAKFVLNSTDSTWTIGDIEAAGDNAVIDGEFTFTGDEVNVSGNANLGDTITLKLIDSDMSVDGTLTNAGTITLGASGSPATLSAGKLENSGTIDVLWGSNLAALELVNDDENGAISVRGANNSLNITDLDGKIKIETAGGNTTLLESQIGDTEEDKNGIVEIITADSGKGVYFKGESSVAATINNNGRMYIGAGSGDGFLTAGIIENNNGAALTIRSGSELIDATITNNANNTITVDGTLNGVTVQGGSIATTNGFAFAGASKLEGVTINKSTATLTLDGTLTVDTASTITVDSVTVADGGSITITAAEGFAGIKQIFILKDETEAGNLLEKVAGDGVFVARSENSIFAASATPETQDTIVVDVAVAGESWGYAYEVGGQTYYKGINAFATFSDALHAAAEYTLVDDPETTTYEGLTIKVLSNTTEADGERLYVPLNGDVMVVGENDAMIQLGNGGRIWNRGSGNYTLSSSIAVSCASDNGRLYFGEDEEGWNTSGVTTVENASSGIGVLEFLNTTNVKSSATISAGQIDVVASFLDGDGKEVSKVITIDGENKFGPVSAEPGAEVKYQITSTSAWIFQLGTLRTNNTYIYTAGNFSLGNEGWLGQSGRSFTLDAVNTNWTVMDSVMCAVINDPGCVPDYGVTDGTYHGTFNFTQGSVLTVKNGVYIGKPNAYNVSQGYKGRTMAINLTDSEMNVTNGGIEVAGAYTDTYGESEFAVAQSSLTVTASAVTAASITNAGTINVGVTYTDANNQTAYGASSIEVTGDVVNNGSITLTGAKNGELITKASLEAAVINNASTIDADYATIAADEISNDGTIDADYATIAAGEISNDGTIDADYATITAGEISNAGTFEADYSTITVTGNDDPADNMFFNEGTATIRNSTLTAGYLKGNFTLVKDIVTAQIVAGTLDVTGANTLELGTKDGDTQAGDMSGATILLNLGATVSGSIYAAGDAATFAGGTIETDDEALKATIGDLDAAKTQLVNEDGKALDIKGEAILAGVVNGSTNTINIQSTAAADPVPAIDASLTAHAIDNAGRITVGSVDSVAASLTGTTITNSGIVNVYENSTVEVKAGIVNHSTGDTPAQFNLKAGSTIIGANGVYMNLGNGKFEVTGASVSKLGINTAYDGAPSDKAEIIINNSVIDLGTGSKSSAIIATKAKTFTIAGESTVVARINGTVTLLDGTTLKDSTFAKYGSKPASTTVVADEAVVTFSGTNSIGKLTVGTDAEITVDGTLTSGTITNNGTITIDGSLSASAISKLGDIVMDATDDTTDTLTVTNAIAGEGTIAITIDDTFVAGTTLITAGSGLLGTTITINGATVAAGDTVLGAYTVVLTDELLTLVEKADTTTLFVDASLTPASAAEAGLAWGVNAFVSFSSAVAGMASDTTTISVTSSAETTGLTNLTVAPKAAALEITGEDVDVELGFKGADQGLYLTPGVEISGVNITTTATDGDAWTGSVYVNYAAAAGTVTIDGDITAAGHIYFCGSADVTGDLTTAGESQILFRAGKAADGVVTVDGSAINSAWIVMVSGKTEITDSSVTIGSFGYDNYADTDAAPIFGSTNSNWTIGELDLVHKQTPGTTRVAATINLDNSEFEVTGFENTNGDSEAEEAAEIGKAITINLVKASTISVANGTLKNDGTITTDTTATVISAKNIANAGSIAATTITAAADIANGIAAAGAVASVPGTITGTTLSAANITNNNGAEGIGGSTIALTGNLTATGTIMNGVAHIVPGTDAPIDKAVIKAANISAVSITNFGVIGSQVEGDEGKILHSLDKITLDGELVNGEYGNVFANKLIAASLDNSNEVLVNGVTVSGLIDNKAGAAIALNPGEGFITIDGGTINNAGYIKTMEGGSIKVATALVNDVYEEYENPAPKALALAKGYIVTDSIEAGSITNKGKIEVGSIETVGAIDNEGIIEVGSIVAGGTIGNTGTFIASGAEKAITTNRFTNDGSVTLKGGVSLGTADAKVALVGNSKNATKFEILDASIYATQFQNSGVLTIDGGTTGATFNVGTVKNSKTSTITISGNVALTITNVQGGTNYKGITLDGAVLTDASVGGAAVTTVANDSEFNGISSFSNLTVADDVELTINANAADCLTVTGDLNSTGSIFLSVGDDLFTETNLVRVITVGGEFNVSSITTEEGYSVIVQDKDVYLLNDAPESMATIVLDITWGTAVPIGETVNFGGNEYTYGVDAFTWATQLVNLTTDTTLIKFRTSEESYGALNLARTDVSVPGSTVAPLDVVVTRVDGTGVGTTAVFDDTKISTDVDFDVQDIEFADLTISGATVTFNVSDTKYVTAEDLLIKDGSEVDFEGSVAIVGGATITNSRVNFGEEDKEALTTIAGNVTITDADVDFDDDTEIDSDADPVTVEIKGVSEVEFDRNTTIYGSLTLDAGSVIEANQGYTFQVSGATINGALLVGNEDDENDLGNTAADLGTIVGGGTIYTDINSALKFNGTGESDFTGKVYINVSGLTAGNKQFQTIVADADATFVVTGTGVVDGTSFRKYFTYDESGLTQIGRAANVYEATVGSQTAINDAVTGTGWAADGSAVDPVYFVDNVTLTGNGEFAEGVAVYLGVNDDQTVILDGKFNVGVYGGNIYGGTTSRAGVNLGGDINVAIEGGSFAKVVVGGDRINVESGRAIYYRENEDGLASINLTIDGGIFKNYVATGILYQGENLQGSVEVGSTNLKINGGTFAKDVYGGNYGNKKASSSCTFVESSNVTITVSNEAKISMAGCLFVGSFGSGKVETTHLTLAGQAAASDALVVKEIWGGCGSDFNKDDGKGGTTYETAVSGTRTLSFTGFQAAISSNRITGFSDVEVLSNDEELLDDDRFDTKATLNSAVKMSDVSNWTFEAGSTLNGAFINDFAGDKLTLTGIGEYFAAYETNSWTLFGDTTNFTNFDKFDSVSYGTTAFDFNGSAWVAADNSYMLSIDENNAMVLSTIIA